MFLEMNIEVDVMMLNCNTGEKTQGGEEKGRRERGEKERDLHFLFSID